VNIGIGEFVQELTTQFFLKVHLEADSSLCELRELGDGGIWPTPNDVHVSQFANRRRVCAMNSTGSYEWKVDDLMRARAGTTVRF
jgi:hypothetical protein